MPWVEMCDNMLIVGRARCGANPLYLVRHPDSMSNGGGPENEAPPQAGGDLGEARGAGVMCHLLPLSRQGQEGYMPYPSR